MLTFPLRFCSSCEEDDILTPAEHELDSWGYGSGGGGFLCDACYDRRVEAYHAMKREA